MFEQIASFSNIRSDMVNRFNLAMAELRDRDPKHFDAVMEKYELKFDERR